MEKPKLIEGGLFVDDRGFLTFFNELPQIKRMYMIESHQSNFVRAFHGHRFESKYMFVVSGDFLVAATPLDSDDMVYDKVKKFSLSSRKPQLLYIPAGYYNGFMNIQKDAKLMIFSTSTLEESKGDDIRKPWNTWNVWDLQDYR